MVDFSKFGDVELQDDKISDAKWLKKSGLYTAEIEMAYLGEADSGAQKLALNFVTEAGEKFSKDVYFTNKKGGTTYIDKKTKKEELLPGMLEVMKYSELVAGDKSALNTTEPLLYQVYDKEKKGDVEKEVQSVVGLTGKVVQLALRETVEDTTVRNSATGDYEKNGETKIVLQIAAMLDGATGKSLSEKKGGLESTYKGKFLNVIAENPILVPKKVTGKLPAGMDDKDSGEHKPKVNADDDTDSAPFGG